MPTLKGRRFFFGTAADLRPGALAAEATVKVDYLLHEMRVDRGQTIFRSLTKVPEFGRSERGDVAASPQYFIFKRGRFGASGVPKPRAVPQRRATRLPTINIYSLAGIAASPPA